MSTPHKEAAAEESSGVSELCPVPNKAARLFELSEGESTHYFSATELLERGKALAAQTAETSEASAQPTPQPIDEPEAIPLNPSLFSQFRRASFPRKASALLLPLACAALLAKPLLHKPVPQTAGKPGASASAAVSTPVAPPAPKLAAAASSATPALPTLPRGMTAAHAAADSVATGDFARALVLYRELARREPNNRAYREATRILGERGQTRTP